MNYKGPLTDAGYPTLCQWCATPLARAQSATRGRPPLFCDGSCRSRHHRYVRDDGSLDPDGVTRGNDTWVWSGPKVRYGFDH